MSLKLIILVHKSTVGAQNRIEVDPVLESEQRIKSKYTYGPVKNSVLVSNCKE